MTKGSRDHYHHGSLRQALTGEARRVVDAKGHDELSLRGVVRAVGVDIAAAYRHFKSKQALLSAVAMEGFDTLGEAMAAAMDAAGRTAATAEATFVASGTAYVAFGVGHAALYRLMFSGPVSATTIGSERARANNQDAPRAYDLLSEALDLLMAGDVISTAARRDAEFFAWSTVHGVVSLLNDGRSPFGPDDAVAITQRSCSLLLAGWRHLEETES